MAGSDYNYEDLADTPQYELAHYFPEGENFTNGSESESYCGPRPTKEDYEFLECMSLVIKGYGNIVLAVFGIIANILAICIFSKKSFKSNFNNLLIALAVCDLLFLVLSIAESTTAFQEHISDSSSVAGQVTFIHHLLFPYFLYPLHNILLSASIFMTVSISIERYLAIFHPLVYRNRQAIHYSGNLGCYVLRARVIKQQLKTISFIFDP